MFVSYLHYLHICLLLFSPLLGCSAIDAILIFVVQLNVRVISQAKAEYQSKERQRSKVSQLESRLRESLELQRRAKDEVDGLQDKYDAAVSELEHLRTKVR